eukprot:m.72924 g.72924  ORF g.72924 m.72924 type:complete len:102 (+) comp12367_c0_seq1:84-389(+)
MPPLTTLNGNLSTLMKDKEAQDSFLYLQSPYEACLPWLTLTFKKNDIVWARGDVMQASDFVGSFVFKDNPNGTLKEIRLVTPPDASDMRNAKYCTSGETIC